MEFLTAGLPILGGIINNLFAGSRQSSAQGFSMQQMLASENFNLMNMDRQFQLMREGRQNQYQDTMFSMRDAGLNPILAYQQGAATGVMPSSATPSGNAVGQAPVSDIGLGAAANTALQVRRQNAELDLLKEQTSKTAAEKETELNRPENVKQSTEQLKATTGYTEQQIIKGMADAMQSTSLSNWLAANPKLAQALIVASFAGGKIGDTLAPFRDAVKSLLAPGGSNSSKSLLRNEQNFDQKFGKPIESPPTNTFQRDRSNFIDRFYGGGG